jgi:beta-ureidopropionase / N-carbamoyl-L-amino-acid hydrolase
VIQHPKIDRDRLLSDLRELAEIGKDGTGVRRPAYSEADIAARHWLAEKFRTAGLDVQIDRVGNVFGRSRVSRALLMGSHSDSVPYGGWLDGSLGVIYALEVARALSAAGVIGAVGVDVVSFADEEGMFAGWFGSRTHCGDFDDSVWRKFWNAEGVLLAEALEAFKDRQRSTLDKSRNFGYLEAHIEQGPRLEALGKPVGIVTSIVGIRTCKLYFSGRADHAGTTPMPMRKDAGKHLVALLSRLCARFKEAAGEDTVWNFGNIIMKPGAANVVPEHAELFVQYRDSDAKNLQSFDAILADEIRAANAAEPNCCSMSSTMATEPIAMDPHFRQVLRDAATQLGHACEDIPSGAGHDAAAVGMHIPIGMLFVPSIGGRSHTPEENTADEHIVAGAEVLLAATQRLLESDA